MAHDHHHHHEGEQNAYYLEQIFTIAVCGALGGVAVMLWAGNKLWWLADRFHPWLLGGGIALLLMVLVRAIAVWRSVDAVDALDAGPAHDHEHGESCDHAHDHGHAHEHAQEQASGHITEHVPVHSHGYSSEPINEPVPIHSHGDHGHDHGWAPWRYVILLLPVLLYFLNLPNKGFSSAHGSGLDLSGLSAPEKTVQSTGVAPEVGFSRLEEMALTEEGRDTYEGKTVTLVGQYYGGDTKKFTLTRWKITCCATDARPLNAVIMLDPKSTERLDPDVYRDQWLQVTGRIHFIERGGRYVTAIMLYPSSDQQLKDLVTIVPQDPNPFVN